MINLDAIHNSEQTAKQSPMINSNDDLLSPLSASSLSIEQQHSLIPRELIKQEYVTLINVSENEMLLRNINII